MKKYNTWLKIILSPIKSLKFTDEHEFDSLHKQLNSSIHMNYYNNSTVLSAKVEVISSENIGEKNHSKTSCRKEKL